MKEFSGFIFFLMCITLLLFLFSPAFDFQKIYAHMFISDDDASSILTILERLRVDAMIANNTISQNITIGQEHLSKLIDSIDDISDSENEFDINSRQFDNSTVNALLFANLVDEILRNYGQAYGIVSSIMTNMSYMSPNLIKSVNMSESIIDIDKYMISKEYAKRALEIYDSNLRIFESNDNKNSLNTIEKNLMKMIDSIDNKTNPLKIMGIAHTEIHPNLQAAFNLTFQP